VAKKNSSLSPLILSGIILGSLIVLLFIVALVVPEYAQPNLFAKLSDLQNYTKIFPESPSRDNKSIVKPDFETFYTNNLPGFFARTLGNLFCYAGLVVPQPWSSKSYRDLMEKLIAEREKKNYKDAFILRLKPPEKARFIIFGDQQGALHSLTRNLTKLKEMDILDDSLALKDEKDHIVFLGDVVSRSAYSMEIMMIAMRLIEKNPERAFYIRGNHESENYWQNYGLKRELELRAESVQTDGEKFPMESMVQRFFNTLPIILYVGVSPDFDKNFLRFSHEGGSDYTMETIDINCYADFLKKSSSDQLSVSNIAGHPTNPAPVDDLATKVIVRSEVKRKSFQSMDGLRQLPPEGGVSSWTVFSAPTQIYQEGVSFFNDAFAILQTSSDIDEWKITLYYQDVRKLDGYKTRTCNVLSGEDVTDIK
jgi:hypothetical protein